MERLAYIVIGVIVLILLIFFALKVIGPKIGTNLDLMYNLLP